MKTETESNIFICITILIILFYGTPDLLDAIIYKLTDGFSNLPRE